MVQEVQTDVIKRQENTLETIESIWTSSRKIIIGRQTRDKYTHSWITMTTSFDTFGSVDPAPWTVIPPITWVTTSDAFGEMEYKLVNGELRIPVAWQYQVSISYSLPPTSWTMTTNLRVNGKKVWTEDVSSGSHSATITLDFGKYDLITVDRSYYYTSIFSWYPAQTVSVTIKNFNS